MLSDGLSPVPETILLDIITPLIAVAERLIYRVVVSVGAGAGACYHYTPGEQRNWDPDRMDEYPCTFGFDIRVHLGNSTRIISERYFSFDEPIKYWRELEDKPRELLGSSSKARTGDMGFPDESSTHHLKRFRIGYFSRPTECHRIIDNWKYKDCYLLIETYDGTWFIYLSVPEFNRNFDAINAVLVDKPRLFQNFDQEAIHREAERRGSTFLIPSDQQGFEYFGSGGFDLTIERCLRALNI